MPRARRAGSLTGTVGRHVTIIRNRCLMCMNKKASERTRRTESLGAGAFTLVELLVVIGIIAVLAALLLPVLSRGKAQAQSAACKNNLKQIGFTLTMYISDARRYPPCLDRKTDQIWAERLNPESPSPFSWTNSSWQCPAYMAHNGIVERLMAPHQNFLTSYSYNANGIVGYGWDGMTNINPNRRLGLGWRPNSAAPEQEVQAPSEMFTVADARTVPAAPGDARIVGYLSMSPYFPRKLSSLANFISFIIFPMLLLLMFE